MKRFFRLPSPAMVIACIALFAAMSGAGYAAATIGTKQIRNNSIRGKDIRNGTIASRDVKKNGLGGHAIAESRLGPVPQAGGLTTWAVVTASGQAARGHGVFATKRNGKGRYTVTFKRDVRGCAYTVSPGDAGTGTPPTGQASAGSNVTNANSVNVRTTDGGSGALDRPFHLVVVC